MSPQSVTLTVLSEPLPTLGSLDRNWAGAWQISQLCLCQALHLLPSKSQILSGHPENLHMQYLYGEQCILVHNHAHFIICMYKCVYKRIHSVTNMYFVHYIYAKVYKPTFHLFTKACRFVGLSSPTQQPLSIGNILLFYKTLFIMIFFTPSLELWKKQWNFFKFCSGWGLFGFFIQRSVFSFSLILRRQFYLIIPKSCSLMQRSGMEIFTLKGKICTSILGGWPRKVG